MENLDKIIAFYEPGKTPTYEEFKKSWTSFFHKSEKLPQTQILGLNDSLDNKVDRDDLINLGVGIKGYGADVQNISDLQNVPNKYEGLAILVINDKDANGNSHIWLYDGVEWKRTPYTSFPKDIITKSKLASTISNEETTAPTPLAIKKRIGLNSAFKSTLNGGTSRYRTIVETLHSGEKTYLINFIPDHNFFERTNKHTRLLLINYGVASVAVFIDNPSGRFYLKIGDNRFDTDFYTTTSYQYRLAVQTTSSEIKLFINDELYVTAPHTYKWLTEQTGGLYTLMINRDNHYNDDLGYFLYGYISPLKIVYELVASDYSDSEARQKLDILDFNKSNKTAEYSRGITEPFKSPSPNEFKYLNFNIWQPKGEKTYLINFIPNKNYSDKRNKYAGLLSFHYGNEFLKTIVDGGSSLIHFITTGNKKIYSTVDVKNLDRIELKYHISETDIKLYVNNELAITVNNAITEIANILKWLYNSESNIRFVVNKDSNMPDNLGYFVYGDISTLKMYNSIVNEDYSMLTASASTNNVSPTYVRIRPDLISASSFKSTHTFKSNGFMNIVNDGTTAQFQAMQTAYLSGNKEVFVSLYTGSNANMVTPSVLNCGSSLTFQFDPGRKVDNEWIHPDIAYCGVNGIGGYKYWMVASCHPFANNLYEDEELFASHDGKNWKRVLPFGTVGETIHQPPHDLVPANDARYNCLLPIPSANTSITINGQAVKPIRTLKHDPAILYDNGYLYIYLFFNFKTTNNYEKNDKRFVNLIRTSNGKDWDVIRKDGSAFPLTKENSKLLWTQTNGVDNYIRFIDSAMNPQGLATEDRAYSIVKVSENEYYTYIDNQDWGASSAVYRYRGTSPNNFDWENRETIIYPTKLTSWHVSVRYYDNKFYLVANGKLYISNDGINFTDSVSRIWAGGVSDRKYKASFCVNENKEVIYCCGLLGHTINSFPANSVDGKNMSDLWRSRVILQQFKSLADMNTAMTRGYADFYIDLHNLSTGKSVLLEAYGVIAPNGGYKIVKIADIENIEAGEYSIYIWGAINCNNGDQFGLGMIEIK